MKILALIALLSFSYSLTSCTNSEKRETTSIWRENFEGTGNAQDPLNPSNRCHLLQESDEIEIPKMAVPEGFALKVKMKVFAKEANSYSGEPEVRLQIDFIDPAAGSRSMHQVTKAPTNQWEEVITQTGPSSAVIAQIWNKWKPVPIYLDDIEVDLVPLDKLGHQN